MLALTTASLAEVNDQDQPRRTSITGDVRVHKAFESRVLGNSRTLVVYLPPGYEAESDRRYPVFYLHDGQNVFDGMTSYLPNKEWRADEAAEALIRGGLIEPLIIVGIENAGVDRANEYLPTRSRRGTGGDEMGGKADLYGRFLVEEVMPFVNRTYRTKTGARHTALGGSSFGGIVTLHLGLTRPRDFGRLAVVSPSLWWDGELMVKRVEGLEKKLPLKVWLDMGTAEGPTLVPLLERTFAAFQRHGWREGRDVAMYVDQGAVHNEDAWARRFGMILLYLFGRR